MIVGPHPTRRVVLHVGKSVKLILRQPFVANGPIEALDVGILLGFAGLDEVDPDASLLRPSQQRTADVFGPLSQRIAAGCPRHSMTWSRLRITRSAGREKSTSMASASRLKSSIILNTRTLRPSLSWSAMKSIDHTSFKARGTPSASGFSLTIRFLCR